MTTWFIVRNDKTAFCYRTERGEVSKEPQAKTLAVDEVSFSFFHFLVSSEFVGELFGIEIVLLSDDLFSEEIGVLPEDARVF